MRPLTERLRERGTRQPAPPWEPNLFGLIAFSCARAAWAVLVSACLLFALSGFIAIQRLDVGDGQDEWRARTAEADAYEALQAAFPGLKPSFIATLSSDRAGEARKAAKDLASLIADQHTLFEDVFAPGTGRFFEEFGLLYSSTEEVEATVRRIEQSAPLFTAIAQSPNLAGLAALAAQTARVTAEGRSPQGLDRLFQEAALAFQGEISGAARPLDWTLLFEHGPSLDDRKWFVMVVPAGGTDSREALDLAIGAISGRYGKSLTITLGGELAPEARPPADARSQGILLGLSAILGSVALVLCLSRAALVFAAIASGAAAIASSLALASFIGRWSTGDIAVIGAVGLSSALFVSTFFGLRHDEAIGRGRRRAISIKLAGHRGGPFAGLVLLSVVAIFGPAAALDIAGLGKSAIAAMAAAALAVVIAFTVTPAILRLFSPISEEDVAEAHWLDAALNDSIGSRGRLVLFGLLAAAALAGAAAAWSLPTGTGGPAAQLHALVAGDQAEATIKSLEQVSAVAAVRWVRSFIPEDEERNRASLARLRGIMPDGLSTPEPLDGDAQAEVFAKLEDSLNRVAGAAAASPELRAAATSLRRSLILFLQPGPPSSLAIAKLEASLFSGLPRFFQRIDGLSRLPPLNTNTLDPQIVRRFTAPDGRLRLEIMPAPGVTGRLFHREVNAVLPGTAGPDAVATAEEEVLRREALRMLLPGFAGLLIACALLCFGWRGLVAGWASLILTAPVFALLFRISGALPARETLLAATFALACAAAAFAPSVQRMRETRRYPHLDDTSMRAGLTPLVTLMAAAAPALALADWRSALAALLGLAASTAVLLLAMPSLRSLLAAEERQSRNRQF